MNILLIEDSEQKAAEITALLKKCLNHPEVRQAASFRSGVKALEEVSHDLLVLDMVLPIRDGEKPVEYGGQNVLAEIQEGSSCRRPSHIICLTAFENVADGFRSEAA